MLLRDCCESWEIVLECRSVFCEYRSRKSERENVHTHYLFLIDRAVRWKFDFSEWSCNWQGHVCWALTSICQLFCFNEFLCCRVRSIFFIQWGVWLRQAKPIDLKFHSEKVVESISLLLLSSIAATCKSKNILSSNTQNSYVPSPPVSSGWPIFSSFQKLFKNFPTSSLCANLGDFGQKRQENKGA